MKDDRVTAIDQLRLYIDTDLSPPDLSDLYDEIQELERELTAIDDRIARCYTEEDEVNLDEAKIQLRLWQQCVNRLQGMDPNRNM